MADLTRRDFLSGMTCVQAGLMMALAQERIQLATITSPRNWEKARERILRGMQMVMGPLPLHKNMPMDIRTLTTLETAVYKQIKIQYLAEPGDYVDAYLLIPARLRQKAPGLLCLHQTVKIGKEEPVGLGGNPNLHYAKELAERGYVCIVPDYPYLGENTFDPYQHGYLSCTMKGIVNHRRAVDVLLSLPQVDKKRIGSIGHSLGGHNTLFVAAFDQRIKAMVTSCGFTKASNYYNGDLKGWSGVRYMPLIAEKYHNSPLSIPFDFPDLLVALAPRPIFINAPLHDHNFDVMGVRECVSLAIPIYKDVFKVGERLVAHYPDAGHEFPAKIRAEAYSFFDRWL